MSIETITLILILSMLLVLIFGLPIGFALGGVGLVFTYFLWGANGLSMVAAATWNLMNTWVLIAAPFFIFTANVLERTGVADDLYKMLYVWMGRVKGGLAIGTVFICCIIAAMVGVVSAGVVSMGLIALPSMLKRGYDKRIAIGCIPAGGALGPLIPPSITMIIYGLYARESVGRMFAGGVLPGLLLASLFCIYIIVRCIIQPDLCPAIPPEERANWREKFRALKGVFFPMMLIILVLGTVFSGICTPTESAAMGAVGSLVIGLIQHTLTWKNLREACERTLKLTSMMIWIIIGATCFSTLYTGMGASVLVQDFVLHLPGGRWAVLIGMQITFFIMGCFIDDIPIIMITCPIYVPIIKALGFDTLWFAVVFIVNMQMAYLTPPFGVALFYMQSILPKGLTLTDIYRSIWPFIICQAVGLALCMIFPEIILWLPRLLLRL